MFRKKAIGPTFRPQTRITLIWVWLFIIFIFRSPESSTKHEATNDKFVLLPSSYAFCQLKKSPL